MQLPGMRTDAIRVSHDLTWWPHEDTYSQSRRIWTRPPGETTWQLEDMACSGSPIDPGHFRTDYRQASERILELFENFRIDLDAHPFPPIRG